MAGAESKRRGTARRTDAAGSTGERSASAANVKVMVYLPPHVHDAMRDLAYADRRTASSVYAEAAESFLARRPDRTGRPASSATTQGERQPPEPSYATRQELEALVARVEGIQRSIEEARPSCRNDVVGALGRETPAGEGRGHRRGLGPASSTEGDGGQVGRAMSVILEALKGATRGLSSSDLNALLSRTGVKSWAASEAKLRLRDERLATRKGLRWFPASAGDRDGKGGPRQP